MNVEFFNQPDHTVKSVYVYYTGSFPKSTKPDKDVTLPRRLWPDAKYYIRCKIDGSAGEKNKQYFKKLYTGSDYTLVNESFTTEADILFIHHENYNAFGSIVGKTLVDYANAIRTFGGKVVIFYNDELFATFCDLRKWIDQRARLDTFREKNTYALQNSAYNEDWSNVTLLMNENRVENWADNRVDTHIADQMTVSYLSDLILYDIDTSTLGYKSTYSKNGIYIPLFTADRIKVCNKLFSGDLDITFKGSKSDDLKDEIKGDGLYVTNSELPTLLREFDWTIYIGKGRPSQYLGATFYEPLLQGIPIFMWTGTDKNKKVFGDMNVYFSTEDELKSLVEKHDMKDLYIQQCEYVFGFTPSQGQWKDQENKNNNSALF